MSLLDQLLSLRSTSRAQERQAALKGFMSSSSVTAMNPRLIQIGRPDTRASSSMARDVVGELTGSVPNSMYQIVDQNSNYYFKENSTAYKDMAKAGIGVGSTVEELQAFLKSKQSAKRPNTNNAIGDGHGGGPLNKSINKTGPLLDPETTDASRQNMGDGYKTGYDNGRNSTNQDFFNIDLGVNRAYDDFQRMLHNSLFQ
jgi:hypothetical protein